jgi:cell division protein FtsL
MQKSLFFMTAIFGLFLFSCLVFSMDEYKTDEEASLAYNITQTTKTVEGLNFRVEEDRPIEKVAGVYRPIDLDAYISLKFGKLSKMISDLAAVTDKRIDDLAKKVDELTQKVKELSDEQEKNKKPGKQTVSAPAP